MKAERATPGMEVPALLIAFVLAPLAWFVVWVVGGLLAYGAARVFGFDLGENDDRGHFLIPLGSCGCAGYWLLMLPVALVLRANGKLSLWTVVGPAAVVPTATIGCVALLAVGKGEGHPLLWFAAVTVMFVPSTVATAAAFWGVYCLFTGERFLSRLPWRGEVVGSDVESFGS